MLFPLPLLLLIVLLKVIDIFFLLFSIYVPSLWHYWPNYYIVSSYAQSNTKISHPCSPFSIFLVCSYCGSHEHNQVGCVMHLSRSTERTFFFKFPSSRMYMDCSNGFSRVSKNYLPRLPYIIHAYVN